MEEGIVKKQGISIIGAFILTALMLVSEIILSIPIVIIDIINTQFGFKGIDSYILTAGEILVKILIVFLVIKFIRKNEEFSLKVKYIPKIKEYLFVLLFLGAHLLIFSNTIGLLMEKIEVSQWLVEAFDEILFDPIIAFVSLCVIAPVFEEVVYRGIILEQLSKRYSMKTSIIVSALIFGLIHFNLHQSVNTFFIGIILGFIYLKTKSLLLCIFWHFANNFLVFISMMYVSDTVSDAAPGFSIVQLVFGIILLIASYVFFNNKEAELESELVV